MEGYQEPGVTYLVGPDTVVLGGPGLSFSVTSRGIAPFGLVEGGLKEHGLAINRD